ncbi:GH23390 [Drosophila grimshawi]|uniref:GH23390 n=1 Tax=Drosophila grimshawi TaxID=7222 RepID=B4K3H7_DROGR|nr:GH23390 [Drosophila grimshawi]
MHKRDAIKAKQSTFKDLKIITVITDSDVMSIYKDVSKLCAIEKYLHMLYRPFVCHLRIGCSLDLKQLSKHLWNTRYEPQISSALIVRLSKPACSLKVYNSGYVSCQGYNYGGAAAGVQHFMAIIENLGYLPLLQQPIHNVVNATFSMPFAIDLNGIYVAHRINCFYNPESFPYLVYEFYEHCIKVAIFPMGYVYVLLSTQPSHTRKVISLILPVLYRHRVAYGDTKLHRSNGETQLSIGDINYQLLWENNFQLSYQCTP